MVAARMSKVTTIHQPVLMSEALYSLNIQPSGTYVDATFGRGGHAQAILNQLNASGRLLAMDKDPEAIVFAQTLFPHETRFKIYHSSFAQMKDMLEEEKVWGKVDGILFDLGVSSPQLDEAERGFSFMRSGKLDMRMDNTKGVDAASWLAKVDEKELANVLFEYGEEKFSRRIAKAIVKARQNKAITTTDELADIISEAHPSWEKHKHPATRSFQAIRIHINHELEELQQGLQQAVDALKKGGRLAVISFHSLEDRIVKTFMQQQEMNDPFPAKLPVKQELHPPRFKRIGKAIQPQKSEITLNPRARSAVLRVGEKRS